MEKTKSAKPKSTPRKNTTKEEKSKEVPKKVVNDEEKSKYKATIEKIWKENYKIIEVQALVSKAKKDRSIEELIDNKVNFEFNSLMYQIKQFNSKYNERRKSYADIKDELITLLKKYEKRLYEVSEDNSEKIDNLLIEKTKLQYLKLNRLVDNVMIIIEDNNNSVRKNISKRISESVKNLMAKITNKTINKEQYIDVSLYNKMSDEIGIKKDIEERIVLKVNSKNEKYLMEVDEITIRIKEIDKEIKGLYEKINKKILDSMESDEKSLSTEVKPKLREKMKIFLLSKFNMPYLVRTKVFEPFEKRLNSIKG